MNNLKERLEEFTWKLKNDPDFEMSDEMQEQYYELKEKIEEYRDYKLIEKFNGLWKTYENPDQLIKDTLDDMYPATGGEFDIDDFFKG